MIRRPTKRVIILLLSTWTAETLDRFRDNTHKCRRLRGSVNLEVFNSRLPLDEELVVLGIEDGLVNVLTSKGNDRLAVVPKTDREEFTCGHHPVC